MNIAVQTNLISKKISDSVKLVCDKNNYNFISIEYPVNHDILPKNFIPIGSTDYIKNLWKNKLGYVFYSDYSFQPTAWTKNLKDKVLNSDAHTMKVKDALKLEGLYFVRPNEDFKLFTGGITNIQDLSTIDENVEVSLSSVKNTGYEYRMFMVNDTVISSSSYRLKSMRLLDKVVPKDAELFASEVSKIWRPANVFVMDIVQVDDGYKVVEFNCFNCSGYYNCDVERIIKNVVEFVKQNQ